MPELTITSPYVHARVDSSTFTMGNPKPESIFYPLLGTLDFASVYNLADFSAEKHSNETLPCHKINDLMTGGPLFCPAEDGAWYLAGELSPYL
jgi:hypothetical protein